MTMSYKMIKNDFIDQSSIIHQDNILHKQEDTNLIFPLSIIYSCVLGLLLARYPPICTTISLLNDCNRCILFFVIVRLFILGR